MKKALIGLLVSFASFAAPQSERGVYWHTPCESWRYEPDVHSYVCGFYGSYAGFVTESALKERDERIAELTKRLTDLEERLKKLENGK